MPQNADAMSVKPHRYNLQTVELAGILLLMLAYVGGIGVAILGHLWNLSLLERFAALIGVITYKVPDWIRDALRKRGGVTEFAAEYRVRNWPMEPSGWSIIHPIKLDMSDFMNFGGVVLAWVITAMEGFAQPLLVINSMLTIAMLMIYLPKPKSVPFALATDGQVAHLVGWMEEANFPLNELKYANLRATTFHAVGISNVNVEMWVGNSDEAIHLECEATTPETIMELDRLLTGWFEQRREAD